LGHDPGVLGWSSVSGSLLSGESASPPPTPPACVPSQLSGCLSLSLSLPNKQINKSFKKRKRKCYSNGTIMLNVYRALLKFILPKMK